MSSFATNWKRTAFATATLAFLLSAGSAFAQHYTRTDLTADNSSVSNAPNIDPNLVNPWGLSRATGSPWWVSDNGTSLSTLYDGGGVAQSLVVSIPGPDGQPGGTPTGTVFNYTSSFEVSAGNPAIFLFSTEDGTISGWNPNVNLNSSVIKINRTGSAVYKGLAIATTPTGPRIYASNFATGAVDVFNGNFQKIAVQGGFLDANLPANYAPFGIQNVGGNIVVTFAHRKPGSLDEDHGAGLGFVDVFDVNGKLVLRLQHNSALNAPWGIAMAPGDFGTFSHRLLVGNFGDGWIHAYNTVTGKLEGTMVDANGTPIAIGGLWALSFGGDTTKNGLATELFFTAGANDEADGIFGKITAIGSDQRGNSE